MKQTAVEWLESELKNGIGMPYKHFEEIINQAKAREREQIKDAWFDGVTNWDSEKNVEDYIKETFKTK